MNDEEKQPFTERLEDTLDEALCKVQNAVYGEREGLRKDIPATMEDPNGFRKVNRLATNRNIVRKLLKKPKMLLAVLATIAAIVVIVVILT